ncbi:fractalkine [Puma concolor]|uniref:Fractalkine n=1 Tax=Puma concolor TaxID=9696 RepID=A0A6P6HKQ5_PUMCO|nr:fractalkine [Puma concolor]
MASPPLSRLLRLAALCHLTALLAGQHLGVKKCNVTCSKMTSEIPVALLVHYQRNQESCGKHAIISTQTLPTQAPSTQVPTILHTASEDQPVWISGPMPENSLGPVEMGPISAHTDALRGSDSMPRLSMVPVSSESVPSREPVASGSWTPKAEDPIHATVDPQRLEVLITPVPDSQAATRRQAVGLLAFLGLLFCLGVAMFAYQSLQGCPRKMAGDMVDGLRYVPRSCGSNSYVLVPV